MQSLEPEIEAFFLGLLPQLGEEWEGATAEEVGEIERLAGRPIPRFYRWFLTTMGGSMGSLDNETSDFSAATVLSHYREGIVTPDSKRLLIGRQSDQIMPLLYFYNLDLPVRDDARVLACPADGGSIQNKFETFREMLAWSALVRLRVMSSPQRCEGTLRDADLDVFGKLAPVLESLGLHNAVPTGPFCGVFDGPDAAMACTVPPREKPQRIVVFFLGGSDAGTLRRILGTIVTESSLNLEIRRWEPPLTE